jgi:hypothetical protein
MPHPFDATVKDLVQRRPADIASGLGLGGPGTPTVLNIDLSLVSTATDAVLAYGDPPALLCDLNFQAARDAGAAQRSGNGARCLPE